MTQLEQPIQRSLAKDAFNETWRFLDMHHRTIEQEDEMVNLAHVSRYHWGIVGQPFHWSRGEWQLSRVYAVLSRPAEAIYHAHRCLSICRQHSLGDFDLACAHEALSRAHRSADDLEGARREYELALTITERISEPEDRAVLYSDLREHAEILGIDWPAGK